MALYMIGAVSISSFPLFSGFVSKEMIVDAAGRRPDVAGDRCSRSSRSARSCSTGLKLPYGTWIGKEGMGPTTNDGARLHVGRVPASMIDGDDAVGGAEPAARDPTAAALPT
jgi:hypothetical protein